MGKLDVALMLWQTSHVGAPTNEWADVEVAKAIEAGQTWLLDIPSAKVARAPVLLDAAFQVRSLAIGMG